MRRNMFYPLIPVAQEIGNLVDEFVNKGFHDVIGGSIWQHNFPAANIKENENDFTIDMAAPGLEKKDFKLGVENGQLMISANKEQSTENKDENYYRKEFSYQSFKRSFQLPEHADTSNISATYNNGVLTIVIGKKMIVKDEKIIEVK